MNCARCEHPFGSGAAYFVCQSCGTTRTESEQTDEITTLLQSAAAQDTMRQFYGR